MNTFSFEMDYPTTPAEVFDAFWSLEDWPKVARHVTGIEMCYADEQVQVLIMHVQTGDRRDAFKTVRIRQGQSIFYFQPSPPPALRLHSGWWHVTEGPEGAKVQSEHNFEVRLEGARRFLDSVGRSADSDQAVIREVQEVLHHNSRQTMVALRDRLSSSSPDSLQEASYATAR